MPRFIALFLFSVAALAFQPTGNQKDVAPIKLIHSVLPVYPADAKRAGRQGTVLLSATIDASGAVTNVQVVSPLGFGLDESAIEAVRQWRYTPPKTKHGEATSVDTLLTINYSLTNVDFNRKLEKQRTLYNESLSTLQKHKENPGTIKTVQDLVKQKFGPGLYLYAQMIEAGVVQPETPDQAWQLTREAADQKFGPALLEVAQAHLSGNKLPKDPEKGWKEMRAAANVGSRKAEFFLGDAYETGQGIEQNATRARDYFRLCAAAGDADCQMRLGRSMLAASKGSGRDYSQALAWLELASDQGNQDARKLIQAELAAATPEQSRDAVSLKGQLVHKPAP